MKSVKEFHQIGNEIPLILFGSINQYGQLPFYEMLCLLIVKDTKSETETFLKDVK